MSSTMENYLDTFFDGVYIPDFAAGGNSNPPTSQEAPVEQAPGEAFFPEFVSAELFTEEESGISGAFGLPVDAPLPSDFLFGSPRVEPTPSSSLPPLDDPSLPLSHASGEAPLPGPSSASSTDLPSSNNDSSTSSPTTTAEPSGEAQKRPAFPAFQGHFASGEEARRHRRAAKRQVNQDPNLAAVKAIRDDWVRRLYDAMINIDGIIDKESSTHRKRFEEGTFDQMDLEAAAHNLFDKAVSVHERGWTRPLVYHKEAVRGKFKDPAKNCCKTRLETLCEVLKKSKAACNDAVQGGLELAKLVYNPGLRIGGKIGNAIANQARTERLKAGTEVLNEGAVAEGKEVKTRKKAEKPADKKGKGKATQDDAQEE